MNNIYIDFNGNTNLTFKKHSENENAEVNDLLLSDSEFNKLKMWLEYTGRDTDKIVIKTIDVKEIIIYKNQITYATI